MILQDTKIEDSGSQSTAGLGLKITTKDLLEAKTILEEIKKILRRTHQRTDIKGEIK